MVVLSWWGQASNNQTTDTQGVQTDTRVAAALAAARRANVECAWHLEQPRNASWGFILGLFVKDGARFSMTDFSKTLRIMRSVFHSFLLLA